MQRTMTLLEIMPPSTKNQKKPLWVISSDAELASDAWTEKAFTDDFLLRSPFPVLGDFDEKTEWIANFHKHYRSELRAGKTSGVEVFNIVSEIQMGAAPEDMLLRLIIDRCDLEAARLNKNQALIFAANMEYYVEEYDGENDFNTYREWLLDNSDHDDIVFAEIPCSKQNLLRDIVDQFVFQCGIPDRHSFVDLGSVFDENWDKKCVGESLYFGDEFIVCLRMQTRPPPGDLTRVNQFFTDSNELKRARKFWADKNGHDEHQARVFFHLKFGAGEARSIQRTLETSARTGRSAGDLRMKMVQKELTYALHGTQSLKEMFCATLALTFYTCDYTAWIDEAKNPKEAERVVKALASVWSTSILCMPDKDLGIVARKGNRCRESLYRLLESASRKFKAATSGRAGDFNFLPRPPAPATTVPAVQKKNVQRNIASKKAKKPKHALKQKLSIKGITDRKGMLTLIKDAHESFEDAKKIKCNFKPIENTKTSHPKNTKHEVKIRVCL